MNTVTTIEEFDALPEGTVLLDGEDVALQKLDVLWTSAGSSGQYTAEQLLAAFDSFRVVWTPEAGDAS